MIKKPREWWKNVLPDSKAMYTGAGTDGVVQKYNPVAQMQIGGKPGIVDEGEVVIPASIVKGLGGHVGVKNKLGIDVDKMAAPSAKQQKVLAGMPQPRYAEGTLQGFTAPKEEATGTYSATASIPAPLQGFTPPKTENKPMTLQGFTAPKEDEVGTYSATLPEAVPSALGDTSAVDKQLKTDKTIANISQRNLAGQQQAAMAGVQQQLAQTGAGQAATTTALGGIQKQATSEQANLAGQLSAGSQQRAESAAIRDEENEKWKTSFQENVRQFDKTFDKTMSEIEEGKTSEQFATDWESLNTLLTSDPDSAMEMFITMSQNPEYADFLKSWKPEAFQRLVDKAKKEIGSEKGKNAEFNVYDSLSINPNTPYSDVSNDIEAAWTGTSGKTLEALAKEPQTDVWGKEVDTSSWLNEDGSVNKDAMLKWKYDQMKETSKPTTQLMLNMMNNGADKTMFDTPEERKIVESYISSVVEANPFTWNSETNQFEVNEEEMAKISTKPWDNPETAHYFMTGDPDWNPAEPNSMYNLYDTFLNSGLTEDQKEGINPETFEDRIQEYLVEGKSPEEIVQSFISGEKLSTVAPKTVETLADLNTTDVGAKVTFENITGTLENKYDTTINKNSYNYFIVKQDDGSYSILENNKTNLTEKTCTPNQITSSFATGFTGTGQAAQSKTNWLNLVNFAKLLGATMGYEAAVAQIKKKNPKIVLTAKELEQVANNNIGTAIKIPKN